MPLSRLRIRLAAGFAFTFVAALGLLAAGSLGYLWRESTRRLEARIDRVAEGVAAGMGRELRELPDSGLVLAAAEVVKEWPANGDAFVIVDSSGHQIGVAADTLAAPHVLQAWSKARNPRFELQVNGADFRASAVRAAVTIDAKYHFAFGVVSFASTEGIETDTELLASALAIAAPLIILLSLAGGYGLARRALKPVDELRTAIADIAPSDLSRRLPQSMVRDEIGALAAEFNALLTRLDDAQRRNRGFIREAAHQIRTPLTLVLGEAGHELAATDRTLEQSQAALTRIRTAAERMRRRVDELFLLAEARSGEAVRLDDDVELDGVVLECTDLMRGRAAAAGRALAIGRAEHVVVRGNAGLIQEALLELLENGCRHGTADAPVTVEAFAEGNTAIIEVSSAGPAFTLPAVGTEQRAEGGLGLPIVQWIASVHSGALRNSRRAELNTLRLELQSKPA